jgi:hypothetical protein
MVFTKKYSFQNLEIMQIIINDIVRTIKNNTTAKSLLELSYHFRYRAEHNRM